MLIRRPPGSAAAARYAPRPGQHRAPRRPSRVKTMQWRPPGVSKVMGGTVPGLLVVAASVAAFGGMFAATSSPPAGASTAKKEVVLPKLPADSGHGRRVVFDQSEQRVWLVAADGEVKRSYLVTGSKSDNLRPGEYHVNGRTRYAKTYRGGGTFEYFVRFTQGRTAAIGFHAVTVLNDGRLVYTSDDLGTPRTPGCVEAMQKDAEALWKFAPMGTDVVVTA